MIVRHDRPRNLNWYLAGPMLFGDVGTSRLYVLGLAVYHAGTAAPWFVAAIGALIIGVGWAYSVVCRSHPDGGGVYSSGRSIHPLLGVVGAILLFTDYVVTAAISGYEAIVHIGGPLGLPSTLAPYITIFALFVLAALNFIGPRRSGIFALIVALGAIAATIVLAIVAVPYLPEGWRQTTAPAGGAAHSWYNFVAVVLALSGIEAVANMSGIMVPPIKRTAKLAIWPVVGEVVFFNFLLVVALCTLPAVQGTKTIEQRELERKAWLELPPAAQAEQPEPPPISEEDVAIKERILEVFARHHFGPVVAAFISVIFGLLLLSACNTAIVDMVATQFLMSRDGEIPRAFSSLNNYGVPMWALLPACILPSILLVLQGDLTSLAALYAIGVVGAITINLACTAYDRKLDVRKIERIGMWALGALLLLIWITIALTKHNATIFLSLMLAGGLTLRFVAKHPSLRRVPVPSPQPVPISVAPELPPLLPFDPARGKILVASRGNLSLIRFALEQARQRNANLFLVFVRQVAVSLAAEAKPMRPEEDGEATSIFTSAEQMARQLQVPLQLIYCESPDPADVILDFAATYAADQVILGVSRRAGILRALRGDVITKVADNLPAETTLLIHA